VVPANCNALEQIVISGEVAGSRARHGTRESRGAKRAMRLPV
jgi:hypothetical protein